MRRAVIVGPLDGKSEGVQQYANPRISVSLSLREEEKLRMPCQRKEAQ